MEITDLRTYEGRDPVVNVNIMSFVIILSDLGNEKII